METKTMEERMTKVEEMLEGLWKSQIESNTRLERLQEVVGFLREEVKEVNRRIDRLVMWLVGLMLTTWVTIMLTLIAILFKLR